MVKIYYCVFLIKIERPSFRRSFRCGGHVLHEGNEEEARMNERQTFVYKNTCIYYQLRFMDEAGQMSIYTKKSRNILILSFLNFCYNEKNSLRFNCEKAKLVNSKEYGEVFTIC